MHGRRRRAEPRHRTRNLLSIAQSISDTTVAQTSSLADYAGEFNGRLQALSRVQGLLLRPGDTTVSLTEIVQAELAAVGATPTAERVVIAGPSITLSHETMQLLALALHELATNALKYGALKSANGHVDVTWRVHNSAGTPHLELTWTESGVELDGHTAGSLRTGYGRTLLEQGIPYEFGATTRFELLKDGIRWWLDMPLPSVDQGGV